MAFRQSSEEMRDSASTRSGTNRSQGSENDQKAIKQSLAAKSAAKLSGKAAGRCQVDRIPQRGSSGENRYTVPVSGVCSASTDTRVLTVQVVGVDRHEDLCLCSKHITQLTLDAADVHIMQVNEAVGLSFSVPATPNDSDSRSCVNVPGSGTSTRSGRSAAAEQMQNANSSERTNAAGFSLEGADAVGRPYGAAASAQQYQEYGTQAREVARKVGEYCRVHTSAGVCNVMNIPVRGNHEISWLGTVTGASAATSESQTVYEVLLHGPGRVVDVPVKGALDRHAPVHLQWIDLNKDDSRVTYQHWGGRTIGGVLYRETAEVSGVWGCEPVDTVDGVVDYLVAGGVSQPTGRGQSKGVGLTRKQTVSPTKALSDAVEAAKPGANTPAFMIGAAAEYEKEAKREAERRAAVEAVEEAKHKSRKMKAVAPKQLYESSEDGAKSVESSEDDSSRDESYVGSPGHPDSQDGAAGDVKFAERRGTS